MATDEEKAKTKQDSLDAIDTKLGNAGIVLNKCIAAKDKPGVDKANACIDRLNAKKTAIKDQAYVAAINDPDFSKAIAAIKAATDDMNKVAPNMADATQFVASLASFFTAAGKVVPALKGLSA